MPGKSIICRFLTLACANPQICSNRSNEVVIPSAQMFILQSEYFSHYLIIKLMCDNLHQISCKVLLKTIVLRCIKTFYFLVESTDNSGLKIN